MARLHIEIEVDANTDAVDPHSVLGALTNDELSVGDQFGYVESGGKSWSAEILWAGWV